MEQQDLLASLTIDKRFPGKSIALQHVFYIAQPSEIQDVDAIQWANTPKGKTRAKKVKGGKRAAEKQDVTSNESTDSLTLLLK